jgi:hypothetical protein
MSSAADALQHYQNIWKTIATRSNATKECSSARINLSVKTKLFILELHESLVNQPQIMIQILQMHSNKTEQISQLINAICGKRNES